MEYGWFMFFGMLIALIIVSKRPVVINNHNEVKPEINTSSSSTGGGGAGGKSGIMGTVAAVVVIAVVGVVAVSALASVSNTVQVNAEQPEVQPQTQPTYRLEYATPEPAPVSPPASASDPTGAIVVSAIALVIVVCILRYRKSRRGIPAPVDLFTKQPQYQERSK